MNMKTLSKHEIEKELIAITQQFFIDSAVLHKREIKLDASLQRHLSIDSLARAELFQRFEKNFGVSFPDKLLAKAETLADIAVYLDETPDVTALLAERRVKQEPKNIITPHHEVTSVNPQSAETLTEVLLLFGEKAADKPHIYFQNEDGQEEVITYKKLLGESLKIAAAMRARGLKEGETVAIMQPSHPSFFYTFFGTLLAGGIPVPIYPPFRMHMLFDYAKLESRILRNAEVRMLVTFEEAEKLSHLLKVFVPSLKHVVTAKELMQEAGSAHPFVAKAFHFALIQYTSGSTSDPKGVLLAHTNLLANIRSYGKAVKITPEDVAVSWLPLYHDLGLIGMWLGSLYHGVPLILMTPFSFLNHPERWLWAIHYHRGTVSGSPNFGYELCVRKIEDVKLEGLDLSSWRLAANGAEKIYPKTLEQFARKFATYGFKLNALLPVYGLAESTVGLAIPPLYREFRVDNVERQAFEEQGIAKPSIIKPKDDTQYLSFVSCGFPLEGHEIRIVDDNQTVLPERHIGNLQFRGPSNMQGYYNNPRATAAVFHDGWIDSGDLAYQADGEVFITGRRKDLIIKAGRNIYPAEIEELVANAKGIRHGCVVAFGVTDNERGTEQLIVIAETREKNKNLRSQIIDNVNTILSTAIDMVPDQIVLVEPHTVPKTSSGKLQRAALKQMYLQGKLAKFHSPPWLQIVKLGIEGFLRKSLSVLVWLSKTIYTIYMACVMVLTMLPVWLFLLVAPRSAAIKVCKLWTIALRTLAFCPIKVIGMENLSKETPVIYAVNHASYIDPLILASFLPADTRYVGKKELTTVPILRTFMRKLDFLAVDRMDLSKGLKDTKRIEEVIKSGNSIVIFPEGTFGYAAGLRPFRLGTFKIAVEANVAVCPIALQGTRYILRDDEKLLCPSAITATVCEPIKPKGCDWQAVTQLRNEVRAQIAKYCGESSLDFIAAKPVASTKPSNQNIN